MDNKETLYPHLYRIAVQDERVDKAIGYAIAAHNSIDQKRKYGGEPYWIHPLEVADIVASVTNDTDVIIAALFHDILEDVTPKNAENYNYPAIEFEFGTRVAKLVVELTDVYTSTDYPKKNRKERKKLERERVATTSPEAKTIKLADFISNTKSIVQHDEGFAKTYLREKEQMLPDLIQGDSKLLAIAGQQTWDGMKKLGMFQPKIVATGS